MADCNSTRTVSHAVLSVDESSADCVQLSQDHREDIHKPLDEVVEAILLEDDSPVFTRFKLSALALGLMTGIFIQLSSLAANFLVLSDTIQLSKDTYIVTSLVCSFATSTIAIAILALMRTIVSITFKLVSMRGDEKQADKEEFLEEVIMQQMEHRYIAGTVIGVCGAWTVTDLLLGTEGKIMYSAITLLIALLLCRFVIFRSPLINRSTRTHAAEEDLPIV